MGNNNMRCCFYCRFWKARESDGLGWCRRHAPRPVAVKAETDSFLRDASFPITDGDQWCGEFKKRKGGIKR